MWLFRAIAKVASWTGEAIISTSHMVGTVYAQAIAGNPMSSVIVVDLTLPLICSVLFSGSNIVHRPQREPPDASHAKGTATIAGMSTASSDQARIHSRFQEKDLMPRVVTRKIDDRHSLLTVSGYRKGEPYCDTVGMTCCGREMEELGDGKYRCRCADWTITETYEYDPPIPKHTENKV